MEFNRICTRYEGLRKKLDTGAKKSFGSIT